jgi:dTDP-4-amino-4,6-dideoxygalactose transaminase
MTRATFTGNFTQQEPIPDDAIGAAVDVLRSGRLHRYNLTPGDVGEVGALEREFADWQGSRYCLATASGGQAIQIALRASGVSHGDKVLTNAFTLAPVPGAIHAVGAQPVLIEIDDNLRIDAADLAAKARDSGARTVLLSHMRGHHADMDAVGAVARDLGLTIIEDCAHTMGTLWNGRKSGGFGLAGCFSTQTYKHINSGEGGLLTSDDPEFMARATILSGSYMLFDRHGAGPDPEAFEEARYQMGNISARMDHLRAAILRPQLKRLEDNVERWNVLYRATADALATSDRIVLPVRPNAERMVGSSIQFRVPGLSQDGCRAVVSGAKERGVELKWFGAPVPAGFTSTHASWRYVPPQALPRTDAILAGLFDMRLPLTFSTGDCKLIGEIIVETVAEVAG